MLKSEQVGFNLLKTKDVYAILDGDKSFRSDALDEESLFRINRALC